MKMLWDVDEEKFLIKKRTEDWIRSRKNAGMGMLNQLQNQEFAR